MPRLLYSFSAPIIIALSLLPAAALAVEQAEVTRVNPAEVTISWTNSDSVTVLAVRAPDAPSSSASVVANAVRTGKLTVAAPAGEPSYFILRDGGDGSELRVAERIVPLQQGSNFRDVGGYLGADGKRVKWGRIFRSGAMPLLTEADYAKLGTLYIGSIIDLRSTDERAIAPDQLDDRTGALFLSNDYSMKMLLSQMMGGDGEYSYRYIGEALAPQYRTIFRRLLADEGAVLYHCSAGQDRTGVATALVLSALGVDRKTILGDYHLSTTLRRPQFEMPPINPADWPGNPIVKFYAAGQKSPEAAKPQPLYSPKGVSHLVQFFEVIDRDYGGVEGYLKKELGIGTAEIARLRTLNLE